MILLDTNVLGRITDSTDPHCAPARRAIHKLFSRNERIIVVPQNLYEFWTVATRKPGAPPTGQNGLGMTPEQASQWLDFFQRRFSLLPDREELLPLWHRLVRTFGIKGAEPTMPGSSLPCKATASRSYSRSMPMTSEACPSVFWIRLLRRQCLQTQANSMGIHIAEDGHANRADEA